jgi:ABC-2 type transport system permease protein
MGKTGIIIRREYLTRVRKKSFILMTLLGPLLMGGMVALSIYLSLQTQDTLSLIRVIDETGHLFEKLPENKTVRYERDTLPLALSRTLFDSNRYYGILYLPAHAVQRPDSIVLFTAKQPSPSVIMVIENNLENIIEELNFRSAGISKSLLDSLKVNVSLMQRSVDASTAEKEFSAGVTAGVGFIGGLLIYMFIFLYGVQVMKGVMEEKSSRIIEVMVSSVKPFELMMGKIIGIAMVGLTQFILWVVLTLAIIASVSDLLTGNSEEMIKRMDPVKQELSVSNPAIQDNPIHINLLKALASLNLGKILLMFIFYFLGGYLLYSALFAAIGAAVDSETDTQQFILPISIPLILAYIIAVSIMTNPESRIGYWFSIIPFTSPVVMMVRMPFDPPVIDLVLSMIALIAGFLFTTWMAARIYRTGILLYGKKVTWKELGKWLFYKA